MLRQGLQTSVQLTGRGKIDIHANHLYDFDIADHLNITSTNKTFDAIVNISRVLQFFGDTFGIEYVLPKMVTSFNVSGRR